MVQQYKIPWAVWRDPDYLDISFPDSWDISLYKMNNSPELSPEEIKRAVLTPIGTPKLSELAKGKKNAVIVVDDMTRITPVSKIIPYVIEELEKSGIGRDKITVLLALGAHKPMTRHDCILKLGRKVVDTINIENHHPFINLTYAGESKLGTPIHISTTYYNADLKISLGGVIPHPLAGYGGGAKIVLPGVCGIQTLAANHEITEEKNAGIGKITGIRKDIEDIAGIVGLDYSINVILTEIGGIAGIFSGHFIDAHRKAIELGKRVYGTKINRLNNNICFCNLFPEDNELNQSTKGFNFLMMAPNDLLDEHATIVLMSSSYEGRGYHSLVAERGAKLYVDPKIDPGILWKIASQNRKIFFFSPNINEYDLHHIFPKGMKLFNDWDDLIEELKKIHKETVKVALFPTSIQIPET
ncbi:MAG: lactate racemase domain-containing protein [Promethearchaeota archaeon]